MTRKITPHKGGRTENLSVRLTPETKARLIELAEKAGVSVPDWITKQVEASANPGAVEKE